MSLSQFAATGFRECLAELFSPLVLFTLVAEPTGGPVIPRSKIQPECGICCGVGGSEVAADRGSPWAWGMSAQEGSNQGSSGDTEESGVSSPTDRIENQPERTEDRWSAEDWRLWNLGIWGQRTSTSLAPTVYDDDVQTGTGGRSTRWTSSTASGSDPWTGWRDPWSMWRTDERTGGGGSDKIVAPEFSGEDDRDGVKARGYLRKVQAWRRVTRLKPAIQALVLYNSLTGKA